MKAWYAADETGRILATVTEGEFATEDMVEFDFPDGFDFAEQDNYVIKDGALTASTRPLTPEEQAAQDEREAEAERQETLSLLPDAVADLSEAVSTNGTTATELADAIAELSEIVSELAANASTTE